MCNEYGLSDRVAGTTATSMVANVTKCESSPYF